MKHWLLMILISFVLMAFPGCHGTRMLRNPKPLDITGPISSATNQDLSAKIDAVIFRDGPGTWAKNADWDEYIISLRNEGQGTLRITSLNVVDSLGTKIESGNNRRSLVKGTKAAKRRYKGEGIKVKAGLEPGAVLATGTLMTAGATSIVGWALYSYEMSIATASIYSPGWVSIFGAGATATGGLIVVPAVAIYRAANNFKVNKEITSRQVQLPVELQAGEEQCFHVFFPVTPSPRQVEIKFADYSGERKLIVDTATQLEGLHLGRSTESPR